MGNSPGGTMASYTSLSPSGLQASTFLSGGQLAPKPTGGSKRRRGPGLGEIWGWHSRIFLRRGNLGLGVSTNQGSSTVERSQRGPPMEYLGCVKISGYQSPGLYFKESSVRYLRETELEVETEGRTRFRWTFGSHMPNTFTIFLSTLQAISLLP
ncbi:hypothetical protein BJY00DRAFT_242129 [Aspergillus carlsbadensis]|nr:hypothetical protein BJY00DRAFT_242129 [Aspergillus carlsbadensis]